MFSKVDIIKSLGKRIAFVPFDENLIKENSLNLSVGKYAWTLSCVTDDMVRDAGVKGIKDRAWGNGHSCYVKEGTQVKGKVMSAGIVIFPHSTTIVQTNEILAVDKLIGGTIHSRVSTAAKGIGHLSTMLGPSYIGRLAVPVHNPTGQAIFLEVGEQFLSIVFHSLKRNSKELNHTDHAHKDNLSKWKIDVSDKDLQEIHPERYKEIKDLVEEMEASDKYKEYYKKLSWRRVRCIKNFWDKNQTLILSVLCIVASIAFFLFFSSQVITSLCTTIISVSFTLLIKRFSD